MSKVAVIYWSGTGNTAAMADAVAQGVESAGGEAEVITADAFDAGSMGSYDAFALGCPARRLVCLAAMAGVMAHGCTTSRTG